MNVYNSMLHDLHHLRLAFATKSDEKKKKAFSDDCGSYVFLSRLGNITPPCKFYYYFFYDLAAKPQLLVD